MILSISLKARKPIKKTVFNPTISPKNGIFKLAKKICKIEETYKMNFESKYTRKVMESQTYIEKLYKIQKKMPL